MNQPPTYNELFEDSEREVVSKNFNRGATDEVLHMLGCFMRVHLRVKRDDPITPQGITFLEEEMKKWWRDGRIQHLSAQGELAEDLIDRERAVEEICDHLRKTLLEVELPL